MHFLSITLLIVVVATSAKGQAEDANDIIDFERHIRKPAFVRMGRSAAAADNYDGDADDELAQMMHKRKPAFVRMGKRAMPSEYDYDAPFERIVRKPAFVRMG